MRGWAGHPGTATPRWDNQKVLYDAKRHPHTAQGDGGWPGGCHEPELLLLSGLGEVLDASGVHTIIDRRFRGMAKGREHWHAPVGDRRTKDRLTDQAIGHFANAWALRHWRGLLHRVRDVFRAAGALVCLGRWLDRVPT